MARPPNIVLHIGTHKTGTTSIQHYLGIEEPALEAAGAAVFRDSSGRVLNKEIFHACVSPSRRRLVTPRKAKRRGLPLLLLFKWRLRQFMRRNPGRRIVISCEMLSYLREPAEMRRLRLAFPRGAKVRVVVCLREKQAFLRSYTAQITKQRFQPSADPRSFAYVEPDSWLLDYDGLLAAFRRLTDDVVVIDYDEAMRAHGNIIPAFCEAAGWPVPSRAALAFLNKSAA